MNGACGSFFQPVSSSATGFRYSTRPSASATTSRPLAVGVNTLTAYGTNFLNQVASDSVAVERGGIGTGKPFVDITNASFTVAATTLTLIAMSNAPARPARSWSNSARRGWRSSTAGEWMRRGTGRRKK